MAEDGCGGGSGMNSESCEFLGGSFGSLDTCHHRSRGQILTTTFMQRKYQINFILSIVHSIPM